MVEIVQNLERGTMPIVKTRKASSIVRIRTNRQVSIPKVIFDDLKLREGDFVEVKRAKDGVLIKPKKLVDPDDILTHEDEAALREGLAQIRRGETIPWEQVKKELKL